MQFKDALTHVLSVEGGYVNNPKDPGGMTNLGVTKRALEAYRGRSVSEKEMRALTRVDVEDFYEKGYWLSSKCDQLPSGVDLVVFDTAVNSGPDRAARILQEALGVYVDGVIGPKTLMALKRCNPLLLLLDYLWYREDFLRGLSTWKTFGRGWTKRLRATRNLAILSA
jgi:lysozyme family protein